MARTADCKTCGCHGTYETKQNDQGQQSLEWTPPDPDCPCQCHAAYWIMWGKAKRDTVRRDRQVASGKASGS